MMVFVLLPSAFISSWSSLVFLRGSLPPVLSWLANLSQCKIALKSIRALILPFYSGKWCIFKYPLKKSHWGHSEHISLWQVTLPFFLLSLSPFIPINLLYSPPLQDLLHLVSLLLGCPWAGRLSGLWYLYCHPDGETQRQHNLWIYG